MCRNILYTFLFITSVQSQLNGDFWWLNSKLNSFKNVKPSLPEIDISDFQNDESAKIIFRDDDLFTNKLLKPIKDRTSKLINTENSDENKIVWPKEEHMKNHDVEVFTAKNSEKEHIEEMKPSKIQNKFEDVLVFSYPNHDKYVTVELNENNLETFDHSSTQSSLMETQKESANIAILFNADILSTATTKNKESQNICTYTKKTKCNELNGFVYEYARRVPTISSGEPFVCCVLPIQPIPNNDKVSQTINFAPNNINRHKRSDVEENISLKQRDFLLKRKFSTQRVNVKPATSPSTKTDDSSDDDYVDPYWNIKNSNSNKPKVENTGNDYYSEDYVQEHTDELPKPGLYGLYSDHAKSPSSWSNADGNIASYGGSDDDYVEDEEDDEENFGYSTIDPRQGFKKHKHKVMPLKLVTSSDENAYDAESHTINFQSNPDFQVFQGFKLLNLFRNTSRVYNKKKPSEYINREFLADGPRESEETEVFDENQLFHGCGRTNVKRANENGKLVGEAEKGSHPWMVLVVLTNRKHNILCYATLVHPRAAVTVADCVDGTAPGDITVIAGLWDMTDRSRSRSRVATVRVHPRYKPGDVDYNLAVLIWARPLHLNGNVQPACLSEPQIDDECKFFGWGILEQGIQQQRSQWQRVTVRACTDRIGTRKRPRSVTEAFCVTAPRGSVTGMGGPLICDVDGRSSIVGTVVSRDGDYTLLPVRDWVMKAENFINGD